MNASLDFLNNTSGTIENDFCIVNIAEERITWKAGMHNPKMRENILYWFAELKKLGANK